TLPFVSYGGSSLVACMAGVGVLLSISRYSTQAAQSPARAATRQPTNGATYATLGLWWRNWRARLSGSGRSRRVTTSRRTTGSSRGRTSASYSVKASSAPRKAVLSRRVTRAKRTIARRTGTSRKTTSGSTTRRSSGTRQVPRRR
ncbi:MAG: FtsW/RodA/SpoVE family cell cycle protein, partial [Anaerolineae bacterium]|nr:FtsW/RodA/SpoVE family cell cycle protein [Anaerolineae bacterium]